MIGTDPLPIATLLQQQNRKATRESVNENEPYSAFPFEPQPGSPIPPEQQLVAFLKIGIMLGAFGPGDKLPSVRQLEQQVGLGRNVIWRAYTKLAECGAITLESRRRAIVNHKFNTEQATQLISVFDWLACDVLDRIGAMRLNAQSFVRFLNLKIHQLELLERDVIFVECNRHQADAWSAEISQVWDLHVPGLEIPALQQMPEESRSRFKTVLTPLFHHDEVSALFQNPSTRVLPLRLAWNQARIEDLRTLPKHSRMAFVLERSECLGYGHLLAQEFNLLCPNLTIDVVPFEDSRQVKKVIDSSRYSRALLSGRVHEAVDPQVLQSNKIVRDALGIDKQSLEEVRVQAGVLL